MRSVNKVILIGNLGADPEVRYTPSGSFIANIRIATNMLVKDQQTGLLEKSVQWHRGCLSEQLWIEAEAKDHLKKGSKVYLEGSLRTRKWQNEQRTNYITEIIVNKLLILDLKDTPITNNNVIDHTTISCPAGNQDTADDLPF